MLTAIATATLHLHKYSTKTEKYPSATYKIQHTYREGVKQPERASEKKSVHTNPIEKRRDEKVYINRVAQLSEQLSTKERAGGEERVRASKAREKNSKHYKLK